MRHRRANYRLVKTHRSYTVEEAARLLNTHKNTVRTWLKSGLSACDNKRPTLILGYELAAFLRDRRAKKKRRCPPGQIYCLRCRAPKLPAGDMIEFTRVTDKIGNLTALCPDCECIMNQRVSMSRWGTFQSQIYGGITAHK